MGKKSDSGYILGKFGLYMYPKMANWVHINIYMCKYEKDGPTDARVE